MRHLILSCLFLVASLAQAAEPAPLARVNGTAIPVARLESLVKFAMNQGREDSPELRQQIRDQLIAQELLRQAALKKKLQNDPLVIAAREEATNHAMIERYVALTIKPDSISEKEVHDRYEKIISTLGDREFKLAVIAVANADEARMLLNKIERKEASFAEVARSHSLLTSGRNGGALDWLSFRTPVVEGQTAGLPLPIAQAVANLGQTTASTLLTAPIAVEKHYWIVRLEGSRATKIPDYDAAAPAVRRQLETQSLERASTALLQGLRASARIEHE